MIEHIQALGNKGLQLFRNAGKAVVFFVTSYHWSPHFVKRDHIAYSTTLYGGSAVFNHHHCLWFIYWHGVGFSRIYSLNAYGAEQALGQLIALSLVRELGPVVGALLFAGRAVGFNGRNWINESN